jgi:hypothetical protein
MPTIWEFFPIFGKRFLCGFVFQSEDGRKSANPANWHGFCIVSCEPAHQAPVTANDWKDVIMTNPISRLAGLATSACLALAIIVGVIDSAQVAAHVTGSPVLASAAFASVTPAVGSLT